MKNFLGKKRKTKSKKKIGLNLDRDVWRTVDRADEFYRKFHDGEELAAEDLIL